MAVHSAKDVPAELPDGLSIVGVPERADARDALCGAARSTSWPRARRWARAACGGARSCWPLRPDLEVRELRGNVDTRLAKLAGGGYDALVLAERGPRRGSGGPARARRSTRTRWCPPRARAAWRWRRAPRTQAAAVAAAVTDADALVAPDRRARPGCASGRHLRHAGGRARRVGGRRAPAVGVRGRARRLPLDPGRVRRGCRGARPRSGPRGARSGCCGRRGRSC